MVDSPVHHSPLPAPKPVVPARTISAFVAGDPGSGDEIVRVLTESIRRAATGFVSAEDVDDILQETCLAVLEYIRRRGGFQGDLTQFAVTIARNRCRNLLNWRKRWQAREIEPYKDWLADPGHSPLDLVARRERDWIIQEVLSQLTEPCVRLLRGFYLENRTIESLRAELGFGTVQGVYSRRQSCLDQAYLILKRRLGNCS